MRKYPGPSYTIQYNPATAEVMIEGSSGPPAGLPLETLVRDWTRDEAKTRRMLMAKASGSANLRLIFKCGGLYSYA